MTGGPPHHFEGRSQEVMPGARALLYAVMRPPSAHPAAASPPQGPTTPPPPPPFGQLSPLAPAGNSDGYGACDLTDWRMSEPPACYDGTQRWANRLTCNGTTVVGLTLDTCRAPGNVPSHTALPPQISSLTNLQSLELRNDRITNDGLWPDYLTGLSRLTSLAVTGNSDIVSAACCMLLPGGTAWRHAALCAHARRAPRGSTAAWRPRRAVCSSVGDGPASQNALNTHY